MLVFMSMTGAGAADKTTCLRRELARKDCHLKIGSYQIRLLSASIARDDGTWHMVDPMLLKGEASQWERAKFEIFKGWPVLQLWLWDTGKGESRVESLHWFTADVRQRELKVLAKGVVRRRHVAPEPPVETQAVGAPAKHLAPKIIYDQEEKHSLKLLKSGELEWTLGREKKSLSKESHGI